MPSFSGRYEFCTGDGEVRQSGGCNLTFDEETLRLVAEKGPGLALDLGDIDAVKIGEYQLSVKIYDRTTILLTQFGKTFQNLCRELLEMWRKRIVQCLLLEDLEEVTRVDGFVQLESAERSFSGGAEIRLYKSNLAILPTEATAFQWRLADIDTANFDEGAYALELLSGKDRLILTKLAKRSREFLGQLADTTKILTDKSAQVIHALFPFLSPGQFLEVASLMKEGRMVAVSHLASIHRLIDQALIQNAIGLQFKPYFNALKQRAAAPGPYFGFKFLRKEEEEKDKEEEEAASGEEPDVSAERESTPPLLELENQSLFFWFAFPLARCAATGPADLAAWECTSQAGRATYVFQLYPPGQPVEVDTAIQQLNRGIVLVNFRREPIYLPDSSLEIQPRFRRYAIAQRNIPALRNLRSMVLGRAIHTSLDAWQHQLESLVKKSI